ncbi:MAG: hypothetical protein P8M68_04520 [Aquiluna sp.]|nr:hypothetical protein [Aquiluna sp.]
MFSSKNSKKATGALALVASLFFAMQIPMAASATTYAGSDSSGPNVLIFSNDPFTDTDQEDTDIRNALIPIASQVTTFDGGDGSESAWSSALTGIDVLIFPEVDWTTYWDSSDTSVLTAASKAYIKSWVSAGKLIIGTGSYSHRTAISDLTDIDFSGLSDDRVSEWGLQISNSALPATVPSANYAGGIADYSLLTDEQKGVMQLVYYNEGADNAGVVNFKVGTGYYIYNAYDWYPDSSDVASGAKAAWNQTLQFAASGDFTSSEPAPHVYSGPVINATAGLTASSLGESLVFSGINLNQIASVTVDGVPVTISSVSKDFITLEIPSLSAGVKDIRGVTAAGGLYIVQRAFEVYTEVAKVQKVNAGSFKGYVAVYAKGYEGHRLSAKVGKDWVIVPSIPAATNDLYRHVEFTGAGVDVAVRIYIDRVLVDTINLTTN